VRHLHAILLGSIALGVRARGVAHGDLLLLLDERAAPAPIADAAIVHTAALEAISLADLASLHHGVAVAGVN
jgi:hypothetical protein